MKSPARAVIATGDELVAPGQALAPGQIWDSNSVMVAALIEQFGGEVVTSLVMPDDPAAVASALRRQAAEGADLLVTIGGASLGDRDVLAEIKSDGIALACWSVEMKPGRPLVSGLVDGIPLIGLPGNPAAAFVSTIQFVRPAVVTLCGRLDIESPTIIARPTEFIPNPGGRRAYLRVLIDTDDSGIVARLAGPQNVANLLTLSRSDGLLVIPEGVEQVESGERCDVQVIRDL
jgi:molybdopterin molybdotransferase